jgi:hypothetical protein
VQISLLQSELRVDAATSWPPSAVHGAPVSSWRSWLALRHLRALPRCRPSRKEACPWDACDSRLQQVLEASCQGPFGSTDECWVQPYPVRFRMELVSMQLPADPQPRDCYQAKACIAPLSVVRRPSASASSSAGVGGELVAAEAARSAWYWTAPADWFVGAEQSNILGLVLELRIATDSSQPASPIADGASMV